MSTIASLKRKDEVRFNMRIPRSTHKTIEENAKRNGFKSMTDYVLALVQEDAIKWKSSKSKSVQVELKDELHDNIARFANMLGKKADALAILTGKVYLTKFKASGEKELEKWLNQREMTWEIVGEKEKHVLVYPSRAGQVPYVVSELRDYLLSHNATLTLNGKQISISSDELEAYKQLLLLRFQTATPLTVSAPATETTPELTAEVKTEPKSEPHSEDQTRSNSLIAGDEDLDDSSLSE